MHIITLIFCLSTLQNCQLHLSRNVTFVQKKGHTELCIHICDWMTVTSELDGAVFKKTKEFHIPHHTRQFHLYLISPTAECCFKIRLTSSIVPGFTCSIASGPIQPLSTDNLQSGLLLLRCFSIMAVASVAVKYKSPLPHSNQMTHLEGTRLISIEMRQPQSVDCFLKHSMKAAIASPT